VPSRLIAPRRVHTGALDFPSGNDGHVELLDSSTIAKYGSGNSLGTAIMLVEGGHSLVSARALRLNNSSTFSKQIFMSGAGNDEPTFAVNKTTGDLSISATWSTMGISDGEWVWLAYVFDTAGANADQLMYFARPGEKLREPSSYATQTAGSGTLISDSGHTLYLGNRWGGGGPYGRRMAWFAWADIEWRFDEISRFIRNPWHGGPRCILNLPLYGSGKADDLVRDISGTANHAKFATTSTDYPVPEVGYPLVESRAYPLRVTPPSVDRDPIPFVRERGGPAGSRLGNVDGSVTSPHGKRRDGRPDVSA
jgi:hypothetical protein